MVNKYCHRCLISFKHDGRMIIHLLKKDKCKINNAHYNKEYEEQLMILLGQTTYDIENDFKKYIIESIDKTTYQCTLCQRKLEHKSNISRHLIESCLNTKYTIRGPLLEHINQSKNSKDKKKFKIKLKDISHISNVDSIIDKLTEKSLQDISGYDSEYINNPKKISKSHGSSNDINNDNIFTLPSKETEQMLYQKIIKFGLQTEKKQEEIQSETCDLISQMKKEIHNKDMEVKSLQIKIGDMELELLKNQSDKNAKILLFQKKISAMKQQSLKNQLNNKDDEIKLLNEKIKQKINNELKKYNEMDSKCEGHIYILQMPSNDNPIYKIGRTSQNPPYKRFGGKKQTCKIILIKAVPDTYRIELLIKHALIGCTDIKHRTDLGEEYFEGNIKKIIYLMDDIIFNYL